MIPHIPPLIIKDKNFNEEKVKGLGCYYLYTASGLFLIKNMDLYHACMQVDNGPEWLAKHEEGEFIHFNIPKLPTLLIERVVGFFKVVYQHYQSEAIVHIYYNKKEKLFKLIVPHQFIEAFYGNGRYYTPLGVEYKNVPSPPGYIRIGTIHSHAEQMAHYSHTDFLDSRFDDSLNIVIGNLDRNLEKEKPSFYACMMLNGEKLTMDEREIIQNYRKPFFPVSRKWFNKIHLIRKDYMQVSYDEKYN